MRVLLLTLGSRGDIEPFIALGIGLRAAGHEVTLGATRHLADVIEGHGLRHAPMDDGFFELLHSRAGREGVQRSGSITGMLSTTLRLARQLGPMQLQIQRDCWAAAQASRPHLIVHHLKLMGAPDLAHALGIPAVLALLVPMVQPTAAWPCPVLPRGPDRLAGAPPGARSGCCMRTASPCCHGLPIGRRMRWPPASGACRRVRTARCHRRCWPSSRPVRPRCTSASAAWPAGIRPAWPAP
ncbi:glycosyltransferase [Piscinibacter sakaiensis]|uniref:glycosyltransferase n=1 Tax=Piscinibacter sakaiensis TaxID=1547922 RepID=UPI00372895ED